MKKLNKRELLKLKLPTRPAGTENKITFGTRLDNCGGQRVLLVSLFLPENEREHKSAWLTVYMTKEDYTTRIWEGEEAGWKACGLEHIFFPDVFSVRRNFTTLLWLDRKEDRLAVDEEAAGRAMRFMRTDAKGTLDRQIYRFQEKIREARRMEQANKKTAGLGKLIAVDLPTPRGMEQDMQRRVLDEDRYLIYRRKGKKRTEAYCTSCNTAVELETPPAHKQKAFCPHCKKGCVALAAGRGRDHLWQHGGYCLAELNRAGMAEGADGAPGLVLREFYVTRDFFGEPPYPVKWEERARYLFEADGTALRMLPETEWEPVGIGSARVTRWRVAGKCHDTMCGYVFSGRFWETVESSCMRYSCLEEYLKRNKTYRKPIEWLALYAKHHQVEKLVKEGFRFLVEGIAEQENSGDCIDWSKQTVPGMLGMNRGELAAVKARFSEGGRTNWAIQTVKKFREAGLAITEENLKLERRIGAYSEFFLERAKEYGAGKCLKYLRAQNRKNPQKNFEWLLSQWQDVYRMARSEKIKMDDAKAFAPDLAALHDELAVLQRERLRREQERLEQARLEQRKKDAEKRIKQAAKDLQAAEFRALVLEPLAWTEGKYLIRPAATPEEIIREGVELDHCVGGYAGRHASGKTNIFFVRRVSEPEKSFVTLELDLKQHRIVQQHGYKNERQGHFDPEVAAFTARWLEQVVKPANEEQLVKRAKAKQKSKAASAARGAA